MKKLAELVNHHVNHHVYMNMKEKHLTLHHHLSKLNEILKFDKKYLSLLKRNLFDLRDFFIKGTLYLVEEVKF